MRAARRAVSSASNNESNNESNNAGRSVASVALFPPDGSRGGNNETNRRNNERTNDETTTKQRRTITAWLNHIGETDPVERNRIGKIAMANPVVLDMIEREMAEARREWWHD